MKTAAFLISLLLAAMALPVLASTEVPKVADFTHETTVMKEKKVPMLLVVSQTHCAFCERLKEDVIRPMIISGDYGDRVLIREILIDPTDPLVDFDGTPRDPNVIASRYQAWVTPTVLLLSSDGTLLAEPLVGIGTPGLYEGYLEEAINSALEQVRAE